MRGANLLHTESSYYIGSLNLGRRGKKVLGFIAKLVLLPNLDRLFLEWGRVNKKCSWEWNENLCTIPLCWLWISVNSLFSSTQLRLMHVPTAIPLHSIMARLAVTHNLCLISSHQKAPENCDIPMCPSALHMVLSVTGDQAHVTANRTAVCFGSLEIPDWSTFFVSNH